MARTVKLVLKNLRASYPHLFTKDEMSGKYTCDFLIAEDDPQLKEIQAALEEVAKDAKTAYPKKTLKTDILTDAAEKNEELAGYLIIRTKTSQDSIRNNVFRRTNMGLVHVEDDGSFYGGCNCQASVVAHWYEFQGQIGVHFLLNGVCQEEGGEPFGNGGSSAGDFENDDDIQ